MVTRANDGQGSYRETRPNANAGLEQSRNHWAEQREWVQRVLPDLPLPLAMGALSVLVIREGRGNVTKEMVRERVYARYPHLERRAA